MRFVPLLPADRPDADRPPGRWLVEAVVGGCVLLVTFAALHSVGLSGLFARSTLVALGALALLLSLARHRHPDAALLGLAALVGILPSAAMLTAIVAYTTSRRSARALRRDLLLVAAALLPLLTSEVRLDYWQGGRWQYAIAQGGVLAVVAVLIPGLVGTAAGQQDQLVGALRERTAAAERAKRSAENESRLHERSRIAAEMHDLVGHRLSLISLHAGGLELALDRQAPELRDEAEQLRRASRDAMDELRQVLGVLGPVGRDTGTDALTDATGTRADILALVEESRAAGVAVAFHWEGEDLTEIRPQVRRAVNRVVRESLTNIHRYALGSAVEVTVEQLPGSVEVVVHNGRPPVPPTVTTGLGSGRGLDGLRERVAVLDGRLTVGPVPDGFEVRAVLPTEPPANGRRTDRPESAPGTGILPVLAGGPAARLRRQLASAVSAALGLAGLGVILLLGLGLVQQTRPYDGPPPTSAVHPGMTEGQVVSVVGSDSSAVRSAAAGREPVRPEGTTSCLFPYTSRLTSSDRLYVTRYCFEDGTLTEITTFTTPLAP
ncbi:sensor histidine kinase [Kitasatospora sp. NPDC096147]|uniref:sensor histidine kinase n=1 Tax=Kitasatospora sp. NPDC096147 TaxID=3364093 RepID=UPI00381DF021